MIVIKIRLKYKEKLVREWKKGQICISTARTPISHFEFGVGHLGICEDKSQPKHNPSLGTAVDSKCKMSGSPDSQINPYLLHTDNTAWPWGTYHLQLVEKKYLTFEKLTFKKDGKGGN